METQAAEASIGANYPAIDHLSRFSSLITLGSVEDSDFNVNKTFIKTFMKRIQIIKRGQSTPTLSSLKIKQNQCHQCLGTTFSH